MSLVEEAYARAHEVLLRCVAEPGFKASALSTGYPQVWARDGAITSLGALLIGDEALRSAAKRTLTTLGDHQSELGLIPLNVDVASGEVSGENAGAVDSNLWFILGHYAHFRITEDHAFLEGNFARLERALLWLRYQDMNECGLLEVPEAGNWADLFAVRYNTLYDNALFVASLRAMAFMANALGKDGGPFELRATAVAERINALMWIDRGWDGVEFGKHLDRLRDHRLEWYMVHYNAGVISSRPYYLPYVAFREFGDFFDGFGNLLCIVLGLAEASRCEQILNYVRAAGVESPYPIKAFFPPLRPGDRDWREYYRSRNLNLPDQYHNGGIWPFLGGLYVAALVRAGRPAVAEAALERLAEANALGQAQRWEFNEWLHGVTGRPMGYALQAWSAAMYAYAYLAVRQGGAPLLADLAVKGA